MKHSHIEPVRDPQRVVVGVDSTPASLRALQWALSYASARNLDVDVVWAWDSGLPADVDPDMSAEQMLDRLIERNRAEYPDLSIDGRVVQGEAAKVLESASNGAALLVVAQRGHGELTGLLLGSVSEHCITHAHCPVLVYRDAPQSVDPDRESGCPANAGADGKVTKVNVAPAPMRWDETELLVRDPGGI